MSDNHQRPGNFAQRSNQNMRNCLNKFVPSYSFGTNKPQESEQKGRRLFHWAGPENIVDILVNLYMKSQAYRMMQIVAQPLSSRNRNML